MDHLWQKQILLHLENIKSTNPIVVGDYVEINNDSQTWMIEKLYDRKNMIVRKSVNLSKQTHIIAANIDQAILMITLQSPLTTTGFIDRFLVSAQAFGVEVILFFNKIDLYSKKLIIQNQNLSKFGRRRFPGLSEIDFLLILGRFRGSLGGAWAVSGTFGLDVNFL